MSIYVYTYVYHCLYLLIIFYMFPFFYHACLRGGGGPPVTSHHLTSPPPPLYASIRVKNSVKHGKIKENLIKQADIMSECKIKQHNVT